MPSDAEILCAQMQKGDICIWAAANPEMATQNKIIRIFGTGGEMECTSPLSYIGTVQNLGDSLIWHVFLEE